MSEHGKEVLAALNRAPGYEGLTQADVQLTRLAYRHGIIKETET